MLEDDYISQDASGVFTWTNMDFPHLHYSAKDLLEWARLHDLPDSQSKEITRIAAILLRLDAAAKQ